MEDADRDGVDSCWWEVLFCVGSELSAQAKVEISQLVVPGVSGLHGCKTRPPTNTSPHHPCLRTPIPWHRLPKRNGLTVIHQKPGLDCIIIYPQARRVLQGQHQHQPPIFTPPRPPVLHRDFYAASASASPATGARANFVILLFTTKKFCQREIY